MSGKVESSSKSRTVTLDGFEVTLYRSAATGMVTVLIATEEAAECDTHGEWAVPRLTVTVNECDDELGPDGEWIRVGSPDEVQP